MQSILCAECKCSPNDCSNVVIKCKKCVKKECCCNLVHTGKLNIKKNFSLIQEIFQNTRKVFVAALGIEILCIISAEIGENVGLSLFGLNLHGIAIAYILGFALAGFSTFMTILGRYNFKDQGNLKPVQGCCSFLEESTNKGFFYSMIFTFQSFKKGLSQFLVHRSHHHMKHILKESMVILVTAESACILTAETTTLLLFQYSFLLAIPLALLGGTFTLAMTESIKKIRNRRMGIKNCSCEVGNGDGIADIKKESHFIPLSGLKLSKKEK
jgi:hypothetical protein